MSTLYTIGTAGHIDHGKTTLVKALTGIDTDRLPEEKARGISIDLGFAHFTTPGGRRVGIVDVPGHERFIKNMVAGAWGLQAFLLVIAADEGVMPQTREHRDILELLGVTRGVIVLTKADLVDPEMLGLVTDEVRQWLKDTPFEQSRLLTASAGDPASVAAVGATLDDLLASLPALATEGLFRLPVDRAFSLKGHGTVVTGTVASGSLSAGATIELLPGGLASRVRSLQAFDQPVDEVLAGQRAALNLADIGPDQVSRGDLCAVPGYFRPSHLVDVRLRLLRGLPRSASPLESGTRIRLYTGTREVIGRVHLLDGPELQEGTSGLAQLRLESPVATARGDRYLLRLYAPMLTIGGGEILDPNPAKHRKSAAATQQLEQLEHADPVELVATTLERGRAPFHTAGSLATELALPEDAIGRALEAGLNSGVLLKTGDHFFHEPRIAEALVRLQAALEAHHVAHPPSPGMDRLTVAHGQFPQMPAEAFERLVGLAVARGVAEADQNLLKRKGWRPRAGDKLAASVQQLEARLAQAPELFLGLRNLEPEFRLMRHEFQELIKFMGVSQLAVKVGPDLLVSKANFERLLETALGVLRVRGTASTPELKDALGLSRKYLIPFLEHLDQTGVTARSGNDRVLRAGRTR